MAFRTITARFAGVCRRCGHPITPGSRIRYGGRGLTYHLKSDCGESALAHDDPGYLEGGNYTRGRSCDDISREGGYEDTMGVSPEALESWRNGGDDPPDPCDDPGF